MKHIDAEQLILYYYGERNETDDRTVIETHLGVCHRCRDEYDALAQTLAAVSSLPIPDRAATYGQDVWQRLAPRLKHSGADALPASSGLKDTGWNIVLQKKPQPARWLEVFTWQRWVLGGALAAMLVASFLVGRFWPRPERPALNAANTTNAGPIPAQARDRVLLAAVADHMERSEILLRELENADEGGGRRIDISVQREQAQELAAGSRLYEQAAQQAGETGISSLLDDLSRVLLTVAHSPSTLSRAELTELRSRIEGPGILFKLQVVNSGIEQRLKPAPERPGPGSVQD